MLKTKTITYKPLYRQVIEEIEKKLGYPSTSSWETQLSRDLTGPNISETRFNALDYGSASGINTVISNYLPNNVRSGLQVVATNPISDYIIVEAGEGLVRGVINKINTNTSIRIPFDDTTQMFYILLSKNGLRVDRTVEYNDLNLAQIIIPSPGTTAVIRDVKDDNNPLDGYISMVNQYYLYGDLSGNFNEDTIELLRNNIGEVLADNLIGNIRLSENLKIINTASTLELDSNSMKIMDANGSILAKFNTYGVFFYNAGGVELSRFTAIDARVGNIKILPNAIQSVNFITNVSGFRILDNGNAEFNDVNLRGILYATTIMENITFGEGVTIIGDLNFDDDIALKAGKKLIFDRDLGRDTYWVYNNATAYLEGWVDGTKRVEL